MVHGGGADEQLRGGLAVAQALAHRPGHLQLLRGEPVDGLPLAALADGLAGGPSTHCTSSTRQRTGRPASDSRVSTASETRNGSGAALPVKLGAARRPSAIRSAAASGSGRPSTPASRGAISWGSAA